MPMDDPRVASDVRYAVWPESRHKAISNVTKDLHRFEELEKHVVDSVPLVEYFERSVFTAALVQQLAHG